MASAVLKCAATVYELYQTLKKIWCMDIFFALPSTFLRLSELDKMVNWLACQNLGSNLKGIPIRSVIHNATDFSKTRASCYCIALMCGLWHPVVP